MNNRVKWLMSVLNGQTRQIGRKIEGVLELEIKETKNPTQ